MNMNNQIKYPVVEQFVSINGEGTKAGELAVLSVLRVQLKLQLL